MKSHFTGFREETVIDKFAHSPFAFLDDANETNDRTSAG